MMPFLCTSTTSDELDVTDWESFDNVKHWLNEVNRRETETPYKLLLGNKCDQDRKRVISFETANEYANQLNIPYLETSARDATNVEQAFVNMASEIKSRIISGSLKTSNANGFHQDNSQNINNKSMHC